MSVILTMVAVNKTATTLLEVTIVPVILGIHWNLTITTAQVMTLICKYIYIYIINYQIWMNVLLVLMDVIRIVSTQKAPIFVPALLDTIL